jgi:hypothetical protein
MELIGFSPHVETKHIHVNYMASFRDKVPERQGTTTFGGRNLVTVSRSCVAIQIVDF